MTVAGAAAAQPAYRVVRLTPEYTTSTTAVSRALGINALGAVVGVATVDVPPGLSVERGFVWLPSNIYGGYPFEHLVPLDHPVGVDPASFSEARDINDRGDIVGAVTLDPLTSNDRAFLFLLSPAYGEVAGEMINLGVLGTGPSEFSEAYAITEPYLVSDGAGGTIERITVVGGASDTTYCAESGFNWSPDGGLTAFMPLNTGAGSEFQNSYAFGVTPLRTGTTLRAVGEGSGCNVSQICPQFSASTAPIFWPGGSLAPSTLDVSEFQNIGDPSNDGFIAALYDVNDSFEHVGYLGGDLNDCVRKAYYWGGVSSTGILLPDPVGAGAFADTEARSINAHGEIVGLDTSNNRGVIWTTSTAEYLDDINLVDLTQISLDEIRMASAVNDSGWIAATARTDDLVARDEGIVLIPVWDCPEDINRDGVVDRFDVQALQATTAAGGCVPRRICYADVNANNIIDNGDKAALLAAMGSTCGQGGTSLTTSDAELWLDLGGSQYLADGGDQAAAAVESAYADDGAETLLNLIELLWN